MLSGDGPGGLVWEVLAGDLPAGGFLTVLRRQRGSAKATSGFQGPKLGAGQLLNYWSGQEDGTPPFVVARLAPQIDSVRAVGESGAEYPLQLSAVVQEFGRRFGAVALHDGDALACLQTDPATTVSAARRAAAQRNRSAGWSSSA